MNTLCFSRSRPKRFTLTRILGRGLVVTYRRTTGPRHAPIGTGVVVLAIGIGLILANDFSLATLGRTLALGGLIFACYQALDRRIKERTAAADETYRLGFDMGHERGHDEGYAEGLAAGRAATRPVVIDLAAKRESNFEAANPRAFSSAAIMGDRD